jgi:uncharacterized protein YbjQ (UPF0145 family)
MRLEAAALGADGVVAVRLSDSRRPGEQREFTALGTAVRSRGRERPGRPFTTDLGGPGVGALLGAGFVPVAIVFGYRVAVIHHDILVGAQTRRLAGNTEVDRLTELTNHVRSGARAEFAAEVDALGANGGLMSDIRLHARRVSAPGHGDDHAAECLIIGNAVARFRWVQEPIPVRPAVILSGRGVPGWRRRGMTER